MQHWGYRSQAFHGRRASQTTFVLPTSIRNNVPSHEDSCVPCTLDLTPYRDHALSQNHAPGRLNTAITLARQQGEPYLYFCPVSFSSYPCTSVLPTQQTCPPTTLSSSLPAPQPQSPSPHHGYVPCHQSPRAPGLAPQSTASTAQTRPRTQCPSALS